VVGHLENSFLRAVGAKLSTFTCRETDKLIKLHFGELNFPLNHSFSGTAGYVTDRLPELPHT